MIVGCYSLHLYCDFGDDKKVGGGNHNGMTFPHQFTGRTEAACFKEARKAGWRIYTLQRKAKCMRCVKARSQSAALGSHKESSK